MLRKTRKTAMATVTSEMITTAMFIGRGGIMKLKSSASMNNVKLATCVLEARGEIYIRVHIHIVELDLNAVHSAVRAKK